MTKSANHNKNRPEMNKVRTKSDWDFIANHLKTSNANCIEKVYLGLDIPKNTFYDAINKHPCMKDAYDFFMEKAGVDREQICIDRNLSTGSVLGSSLPDFLPRYKKNTEWRSKLKNALDDNNLEKIKELMAAAQKPL